MHKETVFIVDDDASIRDSLSLLLSLRGFATALFANAEDFLAALQPDWRGCVVVDIRMPGMSGLELQRCLRERGPSLPVIVITAHGDVAAARQAFLADAVDFIEKPFDGKQLLGAIENALSGFRALDTAQARAAFTKPTLGQLSIREREVMTLMVKGLHNRRIAETLGISPRTVEVHKARVMEKLGAQNIVDLVRLVDKGLT
ncbi:two component transcriptional regulator, LuxR family [Rhodoferax ferrireducens T118]|uniref:Two component transcriptional regulator, LuxR family n=1 Tax=Albidiferax ferrireducens (strain ATCC BAA-621 / DSM 15236 / T118) TaxID=338969 RepID=Q21ZC7_ALBFT|nr:response regulator [Rhodoferax ferrireducens]ABD68876.1 two component transcriptional regulator, LuxR family [Rhodoferax ferrireducens T118]